MVFILPIARHSHTSMKSNAHFSPTPSSKADYMFFDILRQEITTIQEKMLKNTVSEENLSQTVIYQR